MLFGGGAVPKNLLFKHVVYAVHAYSSEFSIQHMGYIHATATLIGHNTTQHI